MRIKRRSGTLHALRWDFLVAAAILLIWWLFSSFDEPRLSPAENPSGQGSRPPDRAEGDILLLFPDSPAADATNLDELDCSYAWFNALWREYGSFATALTRDLSPEILAGRSVVIVPSRVARNMPTAGIKLLSEFARRGGQLVLETPTEAWSSISGVSGDGKVRKALKITSVDGLNVHGPLRKHIGNMPLHGRLISSPPLDVYPTGPMLLEVDGQPGWIQLDHEEGRVHSFLFNVGCSIVAVQQGTPTRDMSFGTRPEPIIPSSARANTTLLQADAPVVDLFTRAIFERLSQFRPLPRLWLYPGNHSGALMMTHPAANDPRAAFGFAQGAAQADRSATVFVASDRFTAVHAQIADELNADTGLLWIQGHSRPPVVEPVGIGGLRPLANELGLDAQFTRLNLALPANRPLRVVRIENSRWENDWSGTFQKLAASRVRLDNSFGPTAPDQYGYLFGSGFPFYPLDDRGLPFPLLEQPFVLHADSLTRTRLSNYLENSAALFHQPIVVNLPADSMRTSPSPGILLAFRDAFELAKKHDHWVTNLGEFLDFLGTRRKSILTSRWDSQARTLTITVNLLGIPSESVPGGAFAGIAIPRTYLGEEIESVVLDDQDVPLRHVATVGASTDRIVKVGGGRHTIQVNYKNP